MAATKKDRSAAPKLHDCG